MALKFGAIKALTYQGASSSRQQEQERRGANAKGSRVKVHHPVQFKTGQ
jgi:hypothetical protein